MSSYKLLVVDDEKLAREYIINLVDWSRFGIDAVYEADNCFNALEIIEDKKPDIVFLDIKMPEMTGTQLLMVLCEKNINTQVVVLSGYSDFESARMMLKTGKVIQYLLKPVSEDLAIEAVAQSIENIEKKKQLEGMKEMLEVVATKEKKRFYQSKIFGFSYEEGTAVSDNEYNSMLIAVMYCEDGSPEGTDVCKDMLVYQISNLRFIYPCEQEGYYALLFASERTGIEEDTHKICSYICEKNGCCCGIGKEYNNVEDLNASYREAKFACESRIFVSKNVITPDDIYVGLKKYIDRDAMIKKMTQHVRAGAREKIDDLLKIMIKSYFFTVSEDESKQMYDLSVAKAYFAYFLEAILAKTKTTLNISNLFSVKNIDELFQMMRRTLHQSCEYYMQDKFIHKQKLISEVKQYIEANYNKPISLNDAADVVFINPSYLSRLFSEVEGEVFTDYVIRVRINEAKKLLINRKLKVYEVAEMVGYKNFKYFLKVFKEKEGITPAHYREKNIFVSGSFQ